MIHPYPSDITVTLPETFTDPFRYRPHPLVTQAAESLMRRIRNSAELSEMFAEGKMMGVLIAEDKDGNLVTLKGFSGSIGGQGCLDGFVPPIFDLTHPGGYYRTHEQKISDLNQEIAVLETQEVRPL